MTGPENMKYCAGNLPKLSIFFVFHKLRGPVASNISEIRITYFFVCSRMKTGKGPSVRFETIEKLDLFVGVMD